MVADVVSRQKDLSPHVIIPVASSLQISSAAAMADTCSVCVEGCQQTPEGLCPFYWQRNASGYCTEAWNCLQFQNTIDRVVGAAFLLVALVYARIIYYRSARADEPRARTASAVEWPSCSFLSLSGVFIFLYKLCVWVIERYPPQNFARCFAWRPLASRVPSCAEHVAQLSALYFLLPI